MKRMILAATAVAIVSAASTQASARQFEGPYVGVEAAYEDYDGTDGEAFGLIAGWDAAVGPAWVIGASVHVTVQGVEGSRTQTQGGNIETTEVSIEDQWGVNVRVGRRFGDRVLVFGQLGYEQLHYSVVRELRAPVCAPPSGGCLISRVDSSSDEKMLTYGAGVEWADRKLASARDLRPW